jgi:hypothetical protein
MAKRKVRVSLGTLQRKQLKEEYSVHKDLAKCAHKYNVSRATAGRIAGIYPESVYNPNAPSAVARRAGQSVMITKRRGRGKALKNRNFQIFPFGLTTLKSYLEGIREGMIIRVAGKDNVQDNHYINGWDDCAELIMKKITEYSKT